MDIGKEDATLRIFKAVVVTGVMALMVLSSTGIGHAQDEEAFIRTKQTSKRDALILSVIYPGLGQMTRGDKVKGVSLFVAETVSLILAVNANEDYSTKERVYSRDLDNYRRIGTGGSSTYADASTSYKDLKDRSDELDDLNTVRNAALISAGIVYAYNIFDALIYSPSRGMGAADAGNSRVRVQSALIDRTPGILVSKSF